MKIFIFLLSLIVFPLAILGQSYLGHTNQSANLRTGPNSENSLITIIPVNSYVYLFTSTTYNDYYHVIFIETNEEGYIHKTVVDIDEELQKSKEKLFQPLEHTINLKPQVEITNNTELTLHLKLNSETYSFDSHETRRITLSVGTYDFVASCPGVIPYYGSDQLESNTLYTWSFYIERK